MCLFFNIFDVDPIIKNKLLLLSQGWGPMFLTLRNNPLRNRHHHSLGGDL